MAAKRDPAVITNPATTPTEAGGRTVTVIGDDAILTTKQAADVSPFGEDSLREAIKSGELDGRFVGGPTGYVTTWKALCTFALGKGKKLEPPKVVPTEAT